MVGKDLARREKLKTAGVLFEDSHFNFYNGPVSPELLIISSGCAWNYADEAVEILGLQNRVGILKLGDHLAFAQRTGQKAS